MSDDNSLPPTSPDDSPKSVSTDRMLALLQTGRIGEEQGRLRWGSNYVFMTSVCDDDLTATAIYKPQQGERPLWDFPDGTLCYRERAAFLVSEALGWQIVPPTVLREASRGLGSLQFYINHNPEITYFNLGESFIPQLRRMSAFDHIANNADRKGGHCLLDEQGKLWGIDHGICFHVAPKLRTVIWDFAGMPLGDDLLPDIQRLCDQLSRADSELRQALRSLLAPKEIEATLKRVQRLIDTACFPEPGYGPNYPWPPV